MYRLEIRTFARKYLLGANEQQYKIVSDHSGQPGHPMPKSDACQFGKQWKVRVVHMSNSIEMRLIASANRDIKCRIMIVNLVSNGKTGD